MLKFIDKWDAIGKAAVRETIFVLLSGLVLGIAATALICVFWFDCTLLKSMILA